LTGRWRSQQPVRCGIFGNDRRNSAVSPQRPCRHVEKTANCSTFRLLRLAHRLLLGIASINMFRAAVLSIVVTLAVGQNAALLCRAWCHPTEGTAAGCQHRNETTSPSVTGKDDCKHLAVGTIAFVREGGYRGKLTTDVQIAVATPRFAAAQFRSNLRSGFESGQRRRLEERRLVITLRI